MGKEYSDEFAMVNLVNEMLAFHYENNFSFTVQETSPEIYIKEYLYGDRYEERQVAMFSDRVEDMSWAEIIDEEGKIVEEYEASLKDRFIGGSEEGQGKGR